MAEKKLQGIGKTMRKLKGLPREEEPWKLTEKELDEAISWFTKKLGSERACPMCESQQWSVGNHVRVLIRDQSSLIGNHYPAIALICGNCAYTALFNAVFMGVLPPGEGG